jgi:hypothetical protein
MNTHILAGMLTLAAATAMLSDTAAAQVLNANLRAPAGCVIGNECRPLNVDVPVYVWLIGGNQQQPVAHPAPRQQIKDTSLDL